MDTTKYDTKMEELRAAAQGGKLDKATVEDVLSGRAVPRVGRPKGPDKVVYKRNVDPALVTQLDAIVKGISKPPEAYEIKDPVEDSSSESKELKSQIKALLEDVERLTALTVNQESKIQRIARLTDNEKLILWIRKYEDLEKAFKELQFRCQGQD